MDHVLVCFRDGTKATKSYVAYCVSQIKTLVQSPELWPVALHLIEMSQHNQPTSVAQFSKFFIKQAVSLGLLEKVGAKFVLRPAFRQVLLEAERQNNIYATIYDKVIYNRDPQPPTDTTDKQDAEVTETPEEAQGIVIYLGGPPLFKTLTYEFAYYDCQTGTYSDIECKPDAEFDIPNGIVDFLKSLA